MTTFLLYLFLCGLNGLAVAYGSSWLCNIEMPDNLRLSFIALTALFSFVLFGIMHIFDQIMLPGVTGELSAAKEKIEPLEKQLAATAGFCATILSDPIKGQSQPRRSERRLSMKSSAARSTPSCQEPPASCPTTSA